MWLALIVTVCTPITWFVPFSRFQHRFPARMVGMTPRLAWTRMRVRALPGFTAGRPALFVQNHVSMFDGHVALFAIPQRFCGVENAAHYRVPFYGWLMKHGGGIPIYPGQTGQQARLIEEARERLGRGYSILAFPEAHRTLDGALRAFKPGAFRLALALGLPIVPVAVRGLSRVLPKGTWIMRPGTIEVTLGPTLETTGLGEADLDRVMHAVHAYLGHAVRTGEPNPALLVLDGARPASA